MEDFKYDGNLNIIVNGNTIKINKVTSIEFFGAKYGITILTKDSNSISGAMKNDDYYALVNDLEKCGMEYPIPELIGVYREYLHNLDSNTENMVIITNPISRISLSLDSDFNKNVIRQGIFKDDHNEINKSGSFIVTDGLYINPNDGVHVNTNEISNLETTETWLLNLLRILQSNDKYKTVEKHPEIENFEVTTYYISTDIFPTFMLPLISNYYNSEYIERDLKLLKLNFLVPVYDNDEIITYVKLKNNKETK